MPEPAVSNRSKQHSYSTASTVPGTVISSALAVLRLMTNSNFIDCCTGRLAGFSRRPVPDRDIHVAL